MKKKIFTALFAFAALVTLAACSSSSNSSNNSNKHAYTIGVASASAKDIWTKVAENVKSDGITLKVKEFTDYTQENPAVEDGSLDLNAFQHKAFLDNWNKEKNGDLVSIGWTLLSPLGLYSNKITAVNQIKDGDTIIVPNDPTNETRALELLQAVDLIKIKSSADPKNTAPKDIETYNKKITIKTLDASQIVASLPDATAAVINSNFVTDQLHKTPADAIYRDTDNSAKVSDVYRNLVAVKKANKDNPDFAKIVKAYQTPEIAALLKKDGDTPAW